MASQHTHWRWPWLKLPTARSARFSSGLGVLDFMKRTSILRCGPEQLARLGMENLDGIERTITIKGIDEADNLQGEVSWISPIARALLKARVGDVVRFQSPAGMREIEITDVQYL